LNKPLLTSHQPPFETQELRKALEAFRKIPYGHGADRDRGIGSFQWGVYAFYDYDGEPIYVGETNERLSGRISRHLTNQRTDAVAMAVLDPFEVCEVEVWPLPQFEGLTRKKTSRLEFDAAKAHLDALERFVFEQCVERSRFKVILNEKNPPKSGLAIDVPPSVRGRIVPDRVMDLRAHPDTRLARRAAVVSRLAQIISERKVQGGLRRVLFAQAQRLRWLAEQSLRLLLCRQNAMHRSAIMARIRAKDTTPERLVRSLLHRLGYRFRLHARELPGTPDIVLRPRRAAIIVHGCFWHGHDCARGRREPKTNADYWRAKIARNRARDAADLGALEARGWRCLTLWECGLRDEAALAERLRAFLG
jgi:DNA mismatch endonuclease Vsr